MCKTRYEWTLIDFATWFAGAVLVPIYETSSPAQVQWNLTDSGAIAVIVETPDHFARFDEVHPELPAHPQRLADRPRRPRQARRGGHRRARRGDRAAPQPRASAPTSRRSSTRRDRPASPRAACSRTATSSSSAATRPWRSSEVVATPGASTLLFITTAHIFARFISVLARARRRADVGHQPDTKQLLPVARQSFKPTFLLAVPRVFEKVYNSSEQKAEAGGKGKIFRAAAETAVDHSMREGGRQGSRSA